MTQHVQPGAGRNPEERPGFDRRMTRDEINGLPLKRWQGPIHVISEHNQVPPAVERLQAAAVLGFDTETRPSFKKGQYYPPALLQLAGDEEVFLFRLTALGLPDPLRDILENSAVIKTGVSLGYDLRELKKMSALTGQGFIDLGQEAKRIRIKNHGLRGLCAVLLNFRISKSAQTSNWGRKKLTEAQIRYAATDAWAGRELYFALQQPDLN